MPDLHLTGPIGRGVSGRRASVSFADDAMAKSADGEANIHKTLDMEKERNMGELLKQQEEDKKKTEVLKQEDAKKADELERRQKELEQQEILDQEAADQVWGRKNII